MKDENLRELFQVKGHEYFPNGSFSDFDIHLVEEVKLDKELDAFSNKQ